MKILKAWIGADVRPGLFEHFLLQGERNGFIQGQPLEVHKQCLFWPEGSHQNEKTLVGLSDILEDLLKNLLGREGIW